MRFLRLKFPVLLSLVLILALIAGCAGQSTQPTPSSGSDSPPPAATPKPKEVIKFGDTQFQSLWINNAIAGYIINKGYGYPVETVEVTTPVLQKSLENGQIDINMEIWRTNILDWYNKVIAEGTVLDLGDTYEKSTQGFYVPRYVIEGDPARNIKPLAPDLKSVFDLPKYKNVFADPEDPSKGVMVSCIIGWQCEKINAIKWKAYGLNDTYNIQAPGAAAALDAAIAGAYKKGEPILAYYWEPTWLIGSYDMVQLEEPAYTEECNAEIQKALNDEISMDQVTEKAGCAYETIGIHKGIHAGLKDRAPEVVEMLAKLNVGTEALNRTAAYMESEKATAEQAAIWFFENYQDRWQAWVPQDVKDKLIEALKADGAKL